MFLWALISLGSGILITAYTKGDDEGVDTVKNEKSFDYSKVSRWWVLLTFPLTYGIVHGLSNIAGMDSLSRSVSDMIDAFTVGFVGVSALIHFLLFFERPKKGVKG